jgi:uncharacterized protein (TIGR03643 family)
MNALPRIDNTAPLAQVSVAQVPAMSAPTLSAADVSRIIEMAWADEISFEAIALQFGLNEADVIRLMRRQLKSSSFRLWRKRVTGRASKHSTRQAHAAREQQRPH